MKTKISMIIPALLTGLLLSSCAWLQENVPVVNNRDANGKFVQPACPQCGAGFTRSATVYQDNNLHMAVSVWTGEVAEGTANAPKLKR